MELVKTVAVLSVAFAASSVFALPKGFQANPTGATTESIQVEGVKHIGVTLENEGEHKGCEKTDRTTSYNGDII